MTTSIFSQQLQSGQTLKTLTDIFISGSGWTIKIFESWKGEEATEIHSTDAIFFTEHSDALKEMARISTDLQSIGYK